MQAHKPNFPFTAVTGQATFKLALTLLTVNPAIGGVLVSGPRGSAKSTLAKGLADVMPGISFDMGLGITKNTAPAFVSLPLSVTEEMVVGTLDLQQVLNEKQVEFKEGLLAKADNGVLYVDEVNLLQDHIVDLLLDVAASGVNVVERDGISHRHDAKFVLLGTMNPDEGELRPQLQDRFGLSVELGNDYAITERIEIVQRREAFDTNNQTFLQAYQKQQDQFKKDILAARVRLSKVECALALQELIATKCHEAQVDGLRADIVWYRTARAHAALNGRSMVTEYDINAVEELVLSHRRQRNSDSQVPPQSPSSNPEPLKTTLNKPFSRPASPNNSGTTDNKSEQADGDWGMMPPQQQKTASSVDFELSHVDAKPKASVVKQHTSTAAVQTSYKPRSASTVNSRRAESGRPTNNEYGESRKVNWLSSFLASAGQWPLRQLRFNRPKKTQAVLHLVLIDTSASTLKNDLFAQAKAVILKVAKTAYINRQQLSIIGFGNQQVETLLPRQRAPKELKALLDTIPAAGGTPFREALERAEKFQQQQIRQTPGLLIKTIIITDGKTRQSFSHVNLKGEVVLIDIEKSSVKRGKGQRIANDLKATYMPLFN